MAQPFIGSEAVANRRLTTYALARRYDRLFRDVYCPRDSATALVRAKAAWLWSKRRGVVAGFSASALHGSKWIDASQAAELIYSNRHPQPGLLVHGDRLAEDEVLVIDGMKVTTPERTALDLACWHSLSQAVPAIDALMRATGIRAADLEFPVARYPGRRGIVSARAAIGLVDAGAQSPKETWLRLLLVDAGLPRPHTQIPVANEFGEPIAYLDMGWPELKLAVEYDGDHHRTSRSQYSYDRRRLEMLRRKGWLVVVVTADDRPADVLRRVREARSARS